MRLINFIIKLIMRFGSLEPDEVAELRQQGETEWQRIPFLGKIHTPDEKKAFEEKIKDKKIKFLSQVRVYSENFWFKSALAIAFIFIQAYLTRILNPNLNTPDEKDH